MAVWRRFVIPYVFYCGTSETLNLCIVCGENRHSSFWPTVGATKPDRCKNNSSVTPCKIHPCCQLLWLQGVELKILMKCHPPKTNTFRLASTYIKVNLSFCRSQLHQLHNLEYAIRKVSSKQAKLLHQACWIFLSFIMRHIASQRKKNAGR